MEAENNKDNIIVKKPDSLFHIYIWAVILLILCLLSLCVGRFPVSLQQLGNWLYSAVTDWSSVKDDQLSYVFISLRFPRILTAIITAVLTAVLAVVLAVVLIVVDRKFGCNSAIDAAVPAATLRKLPTPGSTNH